MLLGLAGCAGSTRPSSGEGDWLLVWAEEFNYSGSPDRGKWTAEKGFVRGGGPQYYTDKLRNVRLVRGGLLIEAVEEQVANERHVAGSNEPHEAARAEMTSAQLSTRHRAAWRGGRIEVRAKTPSGPGCRPTIRLTGVEPGSVEIDVMALSSDPAEILGGVRYSDPATGQIVSRTGRIKTAEPWRSFHTYAVEWDERKVDFFCDEAKYFTFDLTVLQRQGENNRGEFNLSIGLALDDGYDPAKLPARFYIDNVRVFERAK